MDNYLTEMCSGSEAGSYLRLIDFVYQSTLALRVIKKKKKVGGWQGVRVHGDSNVQPIQQTLKVFFVCPGSG